MENKSLGIEVSSSIYNSAIQSLSRREHSVKELRQKLLNKFSNIVSTEGVLVDQVDSVIDKLIDQDYLNENRFVESYIRYRSASGFGPDRIYMELKERGIQPHAIESGLYSEDVQIDWLDLLHHTWSKKFSSAPVDFAEKVKQMRFLKYRGFTDAQISQHFSGLGEASIARVS